MGVISSESRHARDIGEREVVLVSAEKLMLDCRRGSRGEGEASDVRDFCRVGSASVCEVDMARASDQYMLHPHAPALSFGPARWASKTGEARYW
jgi:hypothetical protein